MPATIDDTYAEAFRSIYTEFLLTAKDATWVQHAVNAVTGNGSSTIMCDCEAGLDRLVGPGGDTSFATPDGRPVQSFNCMYPAFAKTAWRLSKNRPSYVSAKMCLRVPLPPASI